MEKPFAICFDFALDDSDFIISLRATASLHHSDPYYVVDDFHDVANKLKKNGPSILPPQEIKVIKRGNARVWVHRDSQRETLLSIAIGKAIDIINGKEKS